MLDALDCKAPALLLVLTNEGGRYVCASHKFEVFAAYWRQHRTPTMHDVSGAQPCGTRTSHAAGVMPV